MPLSASDLKTLTTEYHHIKDIFRNNPESKHRKILYSRLSLTLQRIKEEALLKDPKGRDPEILKALRITSFSVEAKDLALIIKGKSNLEERDEKSNLKGIIPEGAISGRPIKIKEDIPKTPGYFNTYFKTPIAVQGNAHLFTQRAQMLDPGENFGLRAQQKSTFYAWQTGIISTEKNTSENSSPSYLDPAEWDYLTLEQRRWERETRGSQRLTAVKAEYDYMPSRLYGFLFAGESLNVKLSEDETEQAIEFAWQNILLPWERQYIREKSCPQTVLQTTPATSNTTAAFFPYGEQAYGLTPLQQFRRLCADKSHPGSFILSSDRNNHSKPYQRQFYLAKVIPPAEWINEFKKLFEELEIALFDQQFDPIKIGDQLQLFVQNCEYLKSNNVVMLFNKEIELTNEILALFKQIYAANAGLLFASDFDLLQSLNNSMFRNAPNEGIRNAANSIYEESVKFQRALIDLKSDPEVLKKIANDVIKNCDEITSFSFKKQELVICFNRLIDYHGFRSKCADETLFISAHMDPAVKPRDDEDVGDHGNLYKKK